MNRRQALHALGGIAGIAAGGYAWQERRGVTRAELEADPSGQAASPFTLAPAVQAILYSTG
jgi:hypothetical protein